MGIAPKGPPPADVYFAVKDGLPVDAIMWDGVSEYQHPDADDLVKASEWQGPPPVAPPEPTEVTARRSTEDRARRLRADLADDLAAVDAATIAQLRPIVKRLIRAERVTLALILAEQDDDRE